MVICYILQDCPDAEVLLVGNKSDLDSERVISKARGQHLASSLGISFRETSPKSGITSVDEVSGVWVCVLWHSPHHTIAFQAFDILVRAVLAKVKCLLVYH